MRNRTLHDSTATLDPKETYYLLKRELYSEKHANENPVDEKDKTENEPLRMLFIDIVSFGTRGPKKNVHQKKGTLTNDLNQT